MKSVQAVWKKNVKTEWEIEYLLMTVYVYISDWIQNKFTWEYFRLYSLLLQNQTLSMSLTWSFAQIRKFNISYSATALFWIFLYFMIVVCNLIMIFSCFNTKKRIWCEICLSMKGIKNINLAPFWTIIYENIRHTFSQL